jgi:hypothetical protein
MAKLRHVGVRVHAKAYDHLRRRAESHGLTLSEYARKMLFLEMPHLEAFDRVDELLEAIRQEENPEAGVALLSQAHQVIVEARQALVDSKDFRQRLGDEDYETALRELTTAERDLAKRIAQIRGVVEMVRDVRKLGGMER